MTALARGWQKRRGALLDVAPAALALAVMFWAGLIPLQSLPGPDFELADRRAGWAPVARVRLLRAQRAVGSA
jgi:hypothetical protein